MNITPRSFMDRVQRCSARIAGKSRLRKRASVFDRPPVRTAPNMFARPDWTPPTAPPPEAEPMSTPERFGITYAPYLRDRIGLLPTPRLPHRVLDLRDERVLLAA